METYHFIIFTILLFLQEEMEGFLTTLICWFIIIADTVVFKFFTFAGFNFYESVILLDVTFILITIFSYTIHKSNGLLLVMVVSFFINYYMYQLTDTTVYKDFIPVYKSINIILFECLVWCCIGKSAIKPYLDKLTVTVQSAVDKKIEQRFNRKW